MTQRDPSVSTCSSCRDPKMTMWQSNLRVKRTTHHLMKRTKSTASLQTSISELGCSRSEIQNTCLFYLQKETSSTDYTAERTLLLVLCLIKRYTTISLHNSLLSVYRFLQVKASPHCSSTVYELMYVFKYMLVSHCF
jgi:hypothetical protein